MSAPLVTLVFCVRGAVYERYLAQVHADAHEHFLPGRKEIVVLPARPGWPAASTSRYSVILENWQHIRGDYVFLMDVDMRILRPVGAEILAGGLTVTMHPGFPPGTPESMFPLERDPRSAAYVPPGTAERYYPGAFQGGPRDVFNGLAHNIERWSAWDQAWGHEPPWNDESYLNRHLATWPPALVLDERYCWWQYWGDSPAAIVMHLDKTPVEFEQRGS